jgi:hypothetical protein
VCQTTPGGNGVSRVAVADCLTQQLCQATLAGGVVAPQTCVSPACAAGAFSCAGRQMQVCNAGRTDVVNHQLCASDDLCQAGIGLGACPTPCAGFECNGSLLRGCNAGLTARTDLEDCGTAGACDSVTGRCADPCVVGEKRCNGNALEQCADRLLGWQRLQTCETLGLCAASVAANQTACAIRICAPGQRRCTGQDLEGCKADLTGFERVTTCPSGQICGATGPTSAACSDGACSAPFECTSAGEVLACNSSSTGYVRQTPPVLCDSSALCDTSAPGGCRPPTCTPGEYRCLAAEGLQRCNTAGSAFAVVGGAAECAGAVRVSCAGGSLIQNTCTDAAHCQASSAGSCAACLADAECDDGSFCTGSEVCDGSSRACVSSAAPCASGQVCSEAAGCVQCAADGDCASGEACSSNVCTPAPDGGT